VGQRSTVLILYSVAILMGILAFIISVISTDIALGMIGVLLCLGFVGFVALEWIYRKAQSA
jgi:hypothetical protein